MGAFEYLPQWRPLVLLGYQQDYQQNGAKTTIYSYIQLVL